MHIKTRHISRLYRFVPELVGRELKTLRAMTDDPEGCRRDSSRDQPVYTAAASITANWWVRVWTQGVDILRRCGWPKEFKSLNMIRRVWLQLQLRHWLRSGLIHDERSTGSASDKLLRFESGMVWALLSIVNHLNHFVLMVQRYLVPINLS